MAGTQYHEMVQTLPSDRTDQAFRVGVLPGTLWSREHFLDLQRSHASAELFSVYAIPITDQITGRLAIAERLDHLLGGPFRCGVIGHIEMEHFPATMLQHQEHKQYSQPYGRNRKEINRHDLPQVVPKKSLPGLRGRPWNRSQNPGYGSLRYVDAQHL